MQPMEVRFTVADSGQYQVLLDAASPQVLAILDEGEGVSVLFDEPVVAAAGMELGSAVTVTRAGAPVEGSVTRISPWQLAWRPSESSAWLLGGEYRVSIAGLVELAPEAKPVSSSLLPASFTHLASPGEKILVASPPPETPPRASSAFGNTTLFQGRLWVPELGLYYYRARWYDPMLGDFLERDPLGPVDSPNLYQAFGRNPINITDPQGLYEKDFHFYAVYYLARAAGFAPADARLLAWSSQYVDDYEHTKPDPSLWRVTVGLPVYLETLRAFHFLSPFFGTVPVSPYNEVARANMARVYQDRSLVGLGIALHSWADTFAHAGFTGQIDPHNRREHFEGQEGSLARAATQLVPIGHGPAGHGPDVPATNPRLALEAARSIYGLLVVYGRKHGYTRYAKLVGARSWDELEKDPEFWWLLTFHGTLEQRIEEWKKKVSKDFRGYKYSEELVSYEDLYVPDAWLRLFEFRAEAQRRFVLQLEGI
jgi:RHS repeat-associated protein